MTEKTASASRTSDQTTIGEQISVFRRVYDASAVKDWHDTFHIVFGRGIGEADEHAVSLAEQAFTARLSGWPFNPAASAELWSTEYSRQFGLAPSELQRRMTEIGEIGLQAADQLKSHWGDLPALHDAADFWSRKLPADWALTLPALSAEPATESFIDREFLRKRATGTAITKADRPSLFRPLTEQMPELANQSAMGKPVIPVNDQWLTDRRRIPIAMPPTPKSGP